MQRWGHTATGKPRWFCKSCSISRIQKRLDSVLHWQRHLFIKWLIGTQPLGHIADHKSCDRKTLTRWFSFFWDNLPKPVIPHTLFNTYLVVDAIYLAGHSECVLIGRTGNGHVFWLFARQETLVAWIDFFCKLPVPVAVICDAQSGLISAVKTVWPQVPLQRCLAHLQRLAISKLTRHPKTAAGQELLKLASERDNAMKAQEEAMTLPRIRPVMMAPPVLQTIKPAV